MAVFDIDNDGDNDLVIGRCTGTFAFENQTVVPFCQDSLGFEGPGVLRLTSCGDELASGGSTSIELKQAAPNGFAFVAASLVSNPTPLLGGTIITFPPAIVQTVVTDAFGNASVAVIQGGGGPASLFVQAAAVDGSQPLGFEISNALELKFLP